MATNAKRGPGLALATAQCQFPIAHTRSDRDEDLKERAFGVSITNGRRDRGEPFIWISVVFILHNLVVVEGNSNKESTQECSYRNCQRSAEESKSDMMFVYSIPSRYGSRTPISQRKRLPHRRP